MNTSTFSIITVCFNSSKTIINTFESLLAQTYKNFEYIVIDGESSDGTVDLIKEYEKKFQAIGVRFTWMSERDNGIYDAMNKGIKLASGALVGILNSDDTYTNSSLMDIYNAYSENKQYDVYHGLLRYLSNGSTVMIRGCNSDVLYRHMIEHPACFVKLDVYEKYGLFNCGYHFVADYEFLLRLKRAGCKFLLVESIVSNFDENGAGNSFASKRELIKLKKKCHLIGNLGYLFNLLKIYTIEFKSRTS